MTDASLLKIDADNSIPAYLVIAQRIREDILSGVWPMGARLPINQIVEQYGVSAMPVRDALNQLLGEGLVTNVAHKGFAIPVVDSAYIGDFFELRRAIESLLTGRAATRIEDTTLDFVEETAGQFVHRARAGDVAEALRLNRLFHRTINQSAGNPMALEILEGRSALIYALRRKHGYTADKITDVENEHAAIVRALRARDPEWAEAAARAHCHSARASSLRAFKQKTPD
ncbi:MAG: GntR family transcriptional regulator [Rhizobium sp.]|nr:GntR family transcriptional regulator [Rhizobium sp.]